MKLLVINGPSLNLLGIREPGIYGKRSYAELESFIKDVCRQHDLDCEVFQSNHEGGIIDKIHAAAGSTDAIIINAAAYTHTSIAILDALRAVNIPAAEVHLTDINSREDFRKISYPAMYCEKRFIGKGFESYREAIEYFKNNLGYTINFYRPPAGLRDEFVDEAAKMPAICYSIDSLDWLDESVDYFYQNIMDNLCNGAVITMHDCYVDTATLVEKLVPDLLEKGYQIITISDALQIENLDYNITVWYGY